MFLCEKCVKPEQLWLFNMSMGISYGPCEGCKKTGECVDV